MKKHGIFTEQENELLEMSRYVLRDALVRLSKRQSLFSASRGDADADAEQACYEARRTLADTLVGLYGHLRHEVAVAALIDAQGRLISVEEFPRGKAAECEISPRVLASMIIESGAVAVLLAHNHPSGKCLPSTEDVELTSRFESWLWMMECDLIDHLVLTVADWCSIKGEW